MTVVRFYQSTPPCRRNSASLMMTLINAIQELYREPFSCFLSISFNVSRVRQQSLVAVSLGIGFHIYWKVSGGQTIDK